jgi:hypothetical protein
VAEEEVDAVPLEVQEEEEEEEERHTLAFWEDQEEVDWGDAWEEAFQDALEVDGREELEALEDLRFPSLAAVRMSVAARKAEAGDGAVKRSVHSFLHCLKALFTCCADDCSCGIGLTLPLLLLLLWFGC